MLRRSRAREEEREGGREEERMRNGRREGGREGRRLEVREGGCKRSWDGRKNGSQESVRIHACVRVSKANIYDANKPFLESHRSWTLFSWLLDVHPERKN